MAMEHKKPTSKDLLALVVAAPLAMGTCRGHPLWYDRCPGVHLIPQDHFSVPSLELLPVWQCGHSLLSQTLSTIQCLGRLSLFGSHHCPWRIIFTQLLQKRFGMENMYMSLVSLMANWIRRRIRLGGLNWTTHGLTGSWDFLFTWE